jgi:hypothetical protein
MPSIGAGWVSATDLRLALTRARDNRERQVRLLDTLNGRVAKRRDDAERALADIPAIQRSSLVNRAVSTARAEMKRESADARTAHVREAGVIANVAARARQHYVSAIQMLVREGSALRGGPAFFSRSSIPARPNSPASPRSPHRPAIRRWARR